MQSLEPKFDREKFLDVVLYICASTTPDKLGRVKLHKILYFSDMLSFLSSEQPITGERYQKQKFGPVARHLSWALEKLQESGAIEVSRKNIFGYEKFCFRALQSPASNRISNDDKNILDHVIGFVSEKTASEISEFSHADPWKLAEMGEDIPYFTAYYLHPTEVNESDIEWATQEVEKLVASRV